MSRPSALAAATGIAVDLQSESGKALLSTRSRYAAQADALADIDRERRWKEKADLDKMAAKMEDIFEQEITAWKCAEVCDMNSL